MSFTTLDRSVLSSVRVADQNPNYRLVERSDLQPGALIFMVADTRFELLSPFHAFIIDQFPYNVNEDNEDTVDGRVTTLQFDHLGNIVQSKYDTDPRFRHLGDLRTLTIAEIIGEKISIDAKTKSITHYWLPLADS